MNIWDIIKDSLSSFIDFIVSGINHIIGGNADLILGYLSSLGLSIVIPPNVYDIFRELTLGVGYIFPVKALLPIPALMITFYVIKLCFSIYQLIAGTIIKRVKLKL